MVPCIEIGSGWVWWVRSGCGGERQEMGRLRSLSRGRIADGSPVHKGKVKKEKKKDKKKKKKKKKKTRRPSVRFYNSDRDYQRAKRKWKRKNRLARGKSTSSSSSSSSSDSSSSSSSSSRDSSPERGRSVSPQTKTVKPKRDKEHESRRSQDREQEVQDAQTGGARDGVEKGGAKGEKAGAKGGRVGRWLRRAQPPEGKTWRSLVGKAEYRVSGMSGVEVQEIIDYRRSGRIPDYLNTQTDRKRWVGSIEPYVAKSGIVYVQDQAADGTVCAFLCV